MSFQFGTSTMLLLVAFIAISLGGIAPYWGAFSNRDIEVLVIGLAAMAPVFVPMIFAAYAIGRRQLTGATVLTFAIAQAIVAAVFIAIRSM